MAARAQAKKSPFVKNGPSQRAFATAANAGYLCFELMIASDTLFGVSA
jgi:hypothetical protein